MQSLTFLDLSFIGNHIGDGLLGENAFTGDDSPSDENGSNDLSTEPKLKRSSSEKVLDSLSALKKLRHLSLRGIGNFF